MDPVRHKKRNGRWKAMARQMIYTSCKHGRGTEGSGFQVFSYTDGIDKEIRDKLVKLGAYSLGSTGLKTISDDYGDYPLAYRFWAGDVCKAIIRSRYLGLDWSGTRVGSNYLAHSIIFDESDRIGDDVYPVSFVGSESFEKGIDPEQFKSDDEPKALDTMSPIGTDLDFEKVCDFIRRQGQGVEIVKTTISRLLEGKSMIISDSQENLKMWIAAFTMILPKKTAWGISFTTYDPAGKDSQFQEITGGPSIIGIWLPEGRKRETTPSELKWRFDSDDDGLFEGYIDAVFGDPDIRSSYLTYANGLSDMDTIEKAIASFAIHSYRMDPRYSKKLLDMFNKGSRSCFDDRVLYDLGCSLLNDYSKYDSLENVDRLLESLTDEGLNKLLKNKRDCKIVERSKVRNYDDLTDGELRKIREMLSTDCEDNLLDPQHISPIIIMVDETADYVSDQKKSKFKPLKYKEEEIRGFVQQFDSKEMLKNHMVKENKVGYIMTEMPLDPEFKEDVACRYFKDVDNHESIFREILKNPKKFDNSIIKSFYKAEGVLERIANEESVFKFDMSDNIGSNDKNNELIATYRDIIEGLYREKPQEIEPLIETLARRIDDKQLDDPNVYLDGLGPVVQSTYYKIQLIDRKCIYKETKKPTRELKEFAEKLGNRRKEYVLEIIDKATEKKKDCSLIETDWLNQLITIYGGPSDEIGNAFIGGISRGKNREDSDTDKASKNKHGRIIRDRSSNDLELKAKCLYIVSLIERREKPEYSDSKELNKGPLSPLEIEINRCKVEFDNLEKFLKNERCLKEEKSKRLDEYRRIINKGEAQLIEGSNEPIDSNTKKEADSNSKKHKLINIPFRRP